MYIKQIIIQGFKSYKEQTIIEPFSPKHNVIVGRNGSGKSNFFAAIRFVLSDEYNQLSREERAALLHEGAGSAVMSAYVEVIFDNSDERFPTGTKEVVLRRTVGQKKDEYSLNRKNTTKQEIMNLLESAGFSRSNPYYIVPQGRVTQITNMGDAQRLAVLKEVAGTEVYEKRRVESNRIIEDTVQKRDKIDETLDTIRTRLGELEEEKEELRAFQEKDRERRCLEYVVHRREQDALQEALDKLNEEREGGVERTDENREALQQGEAELEQIDQEMAELQQQLKLLGEEKAQLDEERRELAKQRAKIEMEVQSMTENQSAAQQTRTQQAADLKDVQAQIKQREAELAQIFPQYAAKREEEKLAQQQLSDARATVQRLYAKQGRQTQFKSKRDRDQWLTQTIRETTEALATRKAIVMQHSDEITELETQIGQLEAGIAELRSRLDNRGDEQQDLSSEIQQAKDEQGRLSDRRKELWREEAKLKSVMANAQQEQDKSEQFLNRMMDQNTARGLQNVRRLVKKHGIEGAHGVLGELFDFSSRYQTAIEVTAGNSLFDYVVDNDDIAARLSNMLTKEKLGRVTFVPLSRIQNRSAPNLPKASDAVPLLSKLKYQAQYEPAFRQVFGKTIVCPNIQVASQYARSHGVAAITPEGDRSDKKGALTGGYHDARSSRIDGLKREKAAREELEGAQDKMQLNTAELEKLDQRITKCSSDVRKAEEKRLQMESGYGPQQQEVRNRQKILNTKKDELDKSLRARENVEGLVRDLGEQLAGFQNELVGDFKKALSNDEERHLDNASAQIPALQKTQARLTKERSELESRKNILDVELRENLRLRLDNLQAVDMDVEASGESASASSSRVKERQRDLKRTTSRLDTLTKALGENETQLETAQTNISTSTKNRADKAGTIERLRNLIASHAKSLTKTAQKRAALSTRLNDLNTSIRSLGALPDSAFTSATYKNMTSATATKKLHSVQESLKKYGHVNKKAFEQYSQFERQRETLEERRGELDKSDESIRELIRVLDERKDEAIQRTFRQVAREFSAIFGRLVPAGRGSLVIQRKSDAQANGNGVAGDFDDEDAGTRGRRGKRAETVENFSGVAIKVSFNSKHDEQQQISQLSGGQKSLCALALVLAIQASDPAPFYLFDEIDANLDAQYRTAVAEMIRKSANGEDGGTGTQGSQSEGGAGATGQFICTTFRPEMVMVAEKCYGVSYASKSSRIDVVSRDQALDFVEGQVGGR